MAKESSLRRRITRLLRDHGFFVQAIESETNPGIPDMYYRKEVGGWLELKDIKIMPVRECTSIFKSYNHPLSVEQANWISLERRHGGNADILVGYRDELFFVPGYYAEKFNDFVEPVLRGFTVTKDELIDLLKKGNR